MWIPTQKTILSSLPRKHLLASQSREFCLSKASSSRVTKCFLQFTGITPAGRSPQCFSNVVQRLLDAPTEADIQRNLDQLLQLLRDNEDSKALFELKTLIRERRFADESQLLSLVAGLEGDRRHLHWTAFQLQYEGGDHDVGTQAKHFNEVLSKCFDDLHAKNQRKLGLNQLRERRAAFRDSFVARLRSELRSLTRVKKGPQTRPKKGALRKQPPTFSDSDILLDIPPAGRIKLNNIFVCDDSGAIRSIRRLSPIADAVGDAFRYWARRVRVFLSREAWHACNHLGLNDDAVRRACSDAMDRFVDSQQLLFLSPPRPSHRATVRPCSRFRSGTLARSRSLLACPLKPIGHRTRDS